MPLSDEQARQHCLDNTRSFIVQAPAGSGKTELLIQRTLALLATVDKPEHILALTFTRKAALEMRTRLVQTLLNAKTSTCIPTQPHQRVTHSLALAVLERDQQLDWQLLCQPHRLNMMTFDAFAARLTHQLPLLADLQGASTITDEPFFLYEKAIGRLFETLTDELIQVLSHLDNRFDLLENLLIELLAKRDQWLPIVSESRHIDQYHKLLNQSLTNINIELITRAYKLIPTELRQKLHASYTFSQKHLEQAPYPAEAAAPSHAQSHDYWQGLIQLILTTTDTYRKSFNKKLGFPAKSSGKTQEECERYIQAKALVEQCIEALKEIPALLPTLVLIKYAPPNAFSCEQWETLDALFSILPLAVAHLNVIFQEQQQLDFVEVALGAERALGSEDCPTDLALQLDFQLQHILIDEFQDTSQSQHRFLTKLIAGWEPSDGRTLFVVGDPMQSIYRFRQAEVSLFLEAKQSGIGNITLSFISLHANFRSTPAIVEWNNALYKDLFPKQDNPHEGAVSFSKQEAALKTTHTATPSIDIFPTESASLNHMLSLIQSYQKAGQSTAVLVKSRHHLTQFIELMTLHGVDFCAPDVFPMLSNPVVSDCLMLTRALTHLADTTAWLAVLRAPWCGLSLHDLYTIRMTSTTETEEQTTILQSSLDIPVWVQLTSVDVNRLTEQGRQALCRILPILKTAVADTSTSLTKRIKSTWLQLGAPAAYESAQALKGIDVFFELLGEQAYFNPHQFEQRLASRFIAQHDNNSQLTLMTIHKSKGLEFDNVILFGIDRGTRADAHQLIYWDYVKTEIAGPQWLISPIPPRHTPFDETYSFLRYREQQRLSHESKRLLYVATTRAKNALHLIGVLDPELTQPRNNTPLSELWDRCPITRHTTPNNTTHTTTDTEPHNVISRLDPTWKNPFLQNSHAIGPLNSITIANKTAPSEEPDTIELDPTMRYLGIVMHEALEALSNNHDFDIKKRFAQLGLDNKAIHQYTNTITHALIRVQSDNIGKWILAEHNDAHSEWPITTGHSDSLAHHIIDRTFIDNNTRWIIDYKVHPEDDLQHGLPEQWRLQLKRYAKALSQLQPNIPIRTGIYLPLGNAHSLNPIWHECVH